MLFTIPISGMHVRHFPPKEWQETRSEMWTRTWWPLRNRTACQCALSSL